jgi:hypothetical protein
VESVVFTAIAGGVALWRDEPAGYQLSCVLQLLQIVQVFTRPFTFALILGPSLAIVVPTHGTAEGRADLRAAFTFAAGTSRPDYHTGFAVNFVAVAVLIVLIRWAAMLGGTSPRDLQHSLILERDYRADAWMSMMVGQSTQVRSRTRSRDVPRLMPS